MAGSGKGGYEEEMIGGFSALKNVGKSTKEGVLGTAAAPIHMVATEGGHLKEQIWRTVRALGMTFLLMSGVGALIEDRGITKGINYTFAPSPLYIIKHTKGCFFIFCN